MPGRADNGNICLTHVQVTAEPLTGEGAAVEVKLIDARATHQQNTGNLSVAASIDDHRNTGWAVDFDGPPPQPGTDFGEVAVVGGPDGGGFNAYASQVTRLGVFDLPGGGNVVIYIYSIAGDRGIIEVGMPIVESFHFGTPAASSPSTSSPAPSP